MVTPEYLKTGDKVGIVATARKISEIELQPAIDCFTEWGLKVVLGENIYQSHHQFAGTDEQRASDLQLMMDDPEIKAIICARGGYGTVRLIDRLDFSTFIEQPKWIVGYSDITALHSHIQQNFGIESIHATMPVNMQKEGGKSEAAQSLKKALFGQKLQYTTDPHPLNRNGKAKTIITGGNLSMLYSILGSPSDCDTHGKMLFMEDLDEYLYHIDRMMQNLKRNGKFEHLDALIIGGMSDMNDNEIPFGSSAEETIARTVEPYDFPVCFNFPAGHIDRNLAVIFGRVAELVVDDGGGELVFTH